VVILSRYPDGTPASWEMKLTWTMHKKPWLRLFGLALFKAGRRERPNSLEVERGKRSGRVSYDVAPEAPGAP
jgi:hypothetical protein